MNRKTILLSVLLFVCLVLVLSSCATVGIEKVKYQVIQKEGKFEIRQYSPHIIAETAVEAGFDDAGNVAFRKLYNYITGENRSKASIAMTAPVNQKAGSEKIAMTAPVNQQPAEGQYAVSFLMPSKYTMETLPEPLDPEVKLIEIPGRKMAAIRYSGSWSRKKYDARKALLEEFIREKGLTIIGPAIFARYDPPFQLPFLRRNEVLFEVD